MKSRIDVSFDILRIVSSPGFSLSRQRAKDGNNGGHPCRSFFFFPRVCATRQKQQNLLFGKQREVEYEPLRHVRLQAHCSTVAAQQSRNCTFAKKKKKGEERGQGRGRGNKNRKRTSKSKNKKIKIKKKKENRKSENNSPEKKTMKNITGRRIHRVQA